MLIENKTDQIDLVGQEGITIRGCKIGGIGVCITLRRCSKIVIENCSFEDCTAGIYLLDCKDIIVENNTCKNVSRRMPRGQFCQLNKCFSARVNNNYIVNEAGKSDPEDVINVYASNKITVSGNTLIGGGPSVSGGGIMCENESVDVVFSDNTLYDPGQYGIGVASGTNVRVLRNNVYMKQQPFTNVGIYACSFDGIARDITVLDNKIHCINKNGVRNPTWFGSTDANIIKGTFVNKNQWVDYMHPPVQALPKDQWVLAEEIVGKDFKIVVYKK